MKATTKNPWTEKTGEKKHSFENLSLSEDRIHARAEQQGKEPTLDLPAPLRAQHHRHAAPGALGLWLGGILLLQGGDDVVSVAAAPAASSSSPIDAAETLLRSRVFAFSDVFCVSDAALEDVW